MKEGRFTIEIEMESEEVGQEVRMVRDGSGRARTNQIRPQEKRKSLFNRELGNVKNSKPTQVPTRYSQN